ncbi:hypothetical protein [Candidatus Sodalis sp. SoCistrobi]|uniref:hypothetical protein n=1 Tax=Candidatus Sodalis sp. SoCistrobi TaxID=1922216 RepID=UPI001577009C|nr:hypothetical protein [Candidatus Sodalis sp. SoCistrobi]
MSTSTVSIYSLDGANFSPFVHFFATLIRFSVDKITDGCFLSMPGDAIFQRDDDAQLVKMINVLVC